MKLLCKNWYLEQNFFNFIEYCFTQIIKIFQSEADENFLRIVPDEVHEISDSSFNLDRWTSKPLLDVKDFCATVGQHIILVKHLVFYAVEVTEMKIFRKEFVKNFKYVRIF